MASPPARPDRARPGLKDMRERRPVSVPTAVVAALLLVATLVTRLAQQLAVLLLSHPLAALLDDGAHGSSQFSWSYRPRRPRGISVHPARKQTRARLTWPQPSGREHPPRT